MIKFFLTFSFFLLCINPVLADSFFSNDGDITYNRYYDTLGYGIGELLESKVCPNCVEYDISKVYGTNSGEIVGNTSIYDVTDEDWKYGLVRLRNIHDRVSLPPYSAVDFIYWSDNRAGDNVNISSLKVLLSSENPVNGDLRNILYVEGEYESTPIKYIIYKYPRNGITKTYPGLGAIGNSEGILKGMILDRIYVKPGIQFVKWEAEENEDLVMLRIFVKNISNFVLKNILFNHGEYSLKKDFEPGEEYMYEYILKGEDINSLGYANIYDPNQVTQCVVLGEHMESNYVGESVIVAGVREYNGQYISYTGSRIKPYLESFCITRIPYTLYSEEIKLEEEGITEEVVEEENFGEVLGIKKLPQTGINLSSFLVVFPLLWYYLLRRLRK